MTVPPGTATSTAELVDRLTDIGADAGSGPAPSGAALGAPGPSHTFQVYPGSVELVAAPDGLPDAAVRATDTGTPATALRPRRLPRRQWQVAYRTRLGIVDAAAAMLAALVAGAVLSPGETAVHRAAVVAVFTLGWAFAMLLGRTHETRHLGIGSEEFKRVLRSAVGFFAALAVGDFTLSLDRGQLAVIAVPAAAVLDLTGRVVLRKQLHRARYRGERMDRVVAVGPLEAVTHMASMLRREAYHGLEVVAACVVDTGRRDAAPTPSADGVPEVLGVPVLGGLADVPAAVAATGARVVAVTSSGDLPAGSLRRLAWSLEGSGTDMLVSPGLVEVAGPRLAIRPYSSLPLLHVEQPRLSGGARLCKSLIDRVVAAVALLLLSPLFGAVALAISATSRGGVFFRQTRVGMGGGTFRCWKFRSMVADADQLVAELAGTNEKDGALFKIRRDPRVTRVGTVLRRFSLDELPQLINVLTGSMSLVGPRPPLPREVAQYGDDVRRRLLVRPGMTGLWQVSGRSDLSWEDSVRLDLRYVENWSVTLDLYIVWRTVHAVFGGRGAY